MNDMIFAAEKSDGVPIPEAVPGSDPAPTATFDTALVTPNTRRQGPNAPIELNAPIDPDFVAARRHGWVLATAAPAPVGPLVAGRCWCWPWRWRRWSRRRPCSRSSSPATMPGSRFLMPVYPLLCALAGLGLAGPRSGSEAGDDSAGAIDAGSGAPTDPSISAPVGANRKRDAAGRRASGPCRHDFAAGEVPPPPPVADAGRPTLAPAGDTSGRQLAAALARLTDDREVDAAAEAWAAQTLREAAIEGLAEAQFALAVLYENGRGVSRTRCARCCGTTAPPNKAPPPPPPGAI